MRASSRKRSRTPRRWPRCVRAIRSSDFGRGGGLHVFSGRTPLARGAAEGIAGNRVCGSRAGDRGRRTRVSGGIRLVEGPLNYRCQRVNEVLRPPGGRPRPGQPRRRRLCPRKGSRGRGRPRMMAIFLHQRRLPPVGAVASGRHRRGHRADPHLPAPHVSRRRERKADRPAGLAGCRYAVDLAVENSEGWQTFRLRIPMEAFRGEATPRPMRINVEISGCPATIHARRWSAGRRPPRLP